MRSPPPGLTGASDPGLRPTGIPGQYAASVALTLGAHPRVTAAAVAATLRSADWIATAEVTGPGYLTITVTPEALAAVADTVTAAGPACVTSDALAGETVPAAPPGDPLTAPTWEKARAALAAQLTARLAAAAGATVAELGRYRTESAYSPRPPTFSRFAPKWPRRSPSRAATRSRLPWPEPSREAGA